MHKTATYSLYLQNAILLFINSRHEIKKSPKWQMLEPFRFRSIDKVATFVTYEGYQELCTLYYSTIFLYTM